MTTLKKDAINEIDFILIASSAAFELVGQERIKDKIWDIIHLQKMHSL